MLMILILNSCAKKTSDTIATVSSNQDLGKLKMALAWQEANPIQSKSPKDWTNGAYYTSVMKAHQATKDPVYYNAMLEMGKRNKWQTYERLFHADDVVISNAYIYLSQLGEK